MGTSYPLINTKIRTPQRRPTLLHRPRLVDFVHNNIHHKLILISAGAGYGKTSLLTDYARDTDLPVCWYSLDANDAHVLTFLEYLVASVRQRFPQFGESVLEALRSHTGPPEAVEPFVRLLLNEIEHHTREYFVIVLDDYHEVIESEPVNALLDGLLRYLPDQCHIILAARGIPSRLTLSRLATRQEVVGLGTEDLRFTPDEIRELLRQMGISDLTDEQVRILAERSEGWITGILLAAQTSWADAKRDILTLTGASGGVFRYMATEILERQSPEMQRFLLGSSLFTEMTPPLCDGLFGVNNSAQLLRRLTEQNLFTVSLDAEGTWYQYHQLFREFLVSRFERYDPEGYRRLRLRQAELMAYRGHWNRAIDSYIAVQAFAEAANGLEIIVQDTFDAGNWAVLKQWIDALPEAELAKHPRLLLFRGRIHAETGDLKAATAFLEHSYRAYLDHQDNIGAARALVQSAIVERFRGRSHEAIALCRQALSMAGDRDVLTTIQAHHNIGICYAMLGQPDETVRELEYALHVAESHGDDMNTAYIFHDIGTAEVTFGRLASARQHYHRALMYWRKVGNASALASTLQSLGVVHHYLGQYAEAENRLQEGLAKAQAAADARIEAYALASQGDLYRDTRRYDEALEVYRRALEIASATQATRLIIYLLDALGNVYLLKGDLTRARQFIMEAADQVQEGEMAYEAGLCRLSLGTIALQEGQIENARAHLSRASELFAQSGSRRDLARARLQMAMLAYQCGDLAESASHLMVVAGLVQEIGSHQFIVARGPALVDLLHHAEEHGISGLDYIRIRAEIAEIWGGTQSGLEMAPSERVAPREASPSLRFLGLDGGQVLLNGQSVTNWESATARTMAFLFVSHPEGLRRERIIDLLWPDVSPGKGNSLFHSSLYRIRNALGKDIVVHKNGLYRINPTRAYSYDVDEFARLARLGVGDDDQARQARLQAIALYRSAFLEMCDADWCDEMRANLHQQMLDLLLAEAHYLASEGLCREAESYYLRALGFDSFDERAHRGIMWCRARNNDRAGAMRQYRECVRILAKELGVEPSDETRTLYESILEGELAPVPS